MNNMMFSLEELRGLPMNGTKKENRTMKNTNEQIREYDSFFKIFKEAHIPLLMEAVDEDIKLIMTKLEENHLTPLLIMDASHKINQLTGYKSMLEHKLNTEEDNLKMK